MSAREMFEKLKDNIPIKEYRSEGTSDGLTHYEEDKDSWQYKLLDYITNLQEENEELKIKNDILEFRMKQNDRMVICERYRILKQRDDYKSRCEEAIKELNKLDFDNFVYGKTALKDIKKNLQNILNGDDEK